MRNALNQSRIFFFTIFICAAALVKPADAQNFSELENVQEQHSQVADTPTVSAEFESAEPMVPKNDPEPLYDAGQKDFAENLKKVMNPKEYEQFMAAKNYTEKNSTYTLGATDVIEVYVMRHPEVSGKYIINKEGKIQYEFIGDVQLAGLTKEQSAEMLAKSLSTYIVNPQVTVKISEFNSKIVYVVGEVAQPGRIIMRGDTITIREALLEAGLPLLSGKTTTASMFTPSAGSVKRRNVDVHALLYKGDLRQNFIMQPGDTLYIPPTFWAKALRVISPVAQPIGAAASTTSTVGN